MLRIGNKWDQWLVPETEKDYYKRLRAFLADEYLRSGHRIFPDKNDIFNAFVYTDFDNVRAVILGQDPYHGFGQAHGLCFSVKNNNPPPSLVNIYKEIKADIGFVSSENGDLTQWAKQGVFLLNAVLTVKNHQANSHKGKIWEKLTSATIDYLGHSDEPKVFLLWGRDARAMKPYIDQTKHLVLECAHPSPLSAYNGLVASTFREQMSS